MEMLFGCCCMCACVCVLVCVCRSFKQPKEHESVSTFGQCHHLHFLASTNKLNLLNCLTDLFSCLYITCWGDSDKTTSTFSFVFCCFVVFCLFVMFNAYAWTKCKLCLIMHKQIIAGHPFILHSMVFSICVLCTSSICCKFILIVFGLRLNEDIFKCNLLFSMDTFRYFIFFLLKRNT